MKDMATKIIVWNSVGNMLCSMPLTQKKKIPKPYPCYKGRMEHRPFKEVLGMRMSLFEM